VVAETNFFSQLGLGSEEFPLLSLPSVDVYLLLFLENPDKVQPPMISIALGYLSANDIAQSNLADS